MKKRLISLMSLFLAMTCSALAQSSPWELIVQSASGESISVALQQKPVLSTSSTGYVLTYNFNDGTETVNYTWSELKTLRLAELEADAIKQVPAQPEVLNPTISRQAGDVTIKGTKPNSPVKIYDLNGQMVMQSVADADGSVSVATSSLSRGVYIIKTTSSTFKFMNR